jgi:hypothetical protein
MATVAVVVTPAKLVFAVEEAETEPKKNSEEPGAARAVVTA